MSATFIGSSNAQFDFSSATTATFATPSSVSPGDTLVIVIAGTDVAAIPVVLPDGWAEIGEFHSDDGAVVVVLARTVLGDEPPSHVITFISVAGLSAGMLAYTALDASEAVGGLAGSPVTDYTAATTSMLVPSALVTDTLQVYLGVVLTVVAPVTFTSIPNSDVLINLNAASDGTSRQLLIFSLPAVALGVIPEQHVMLASARAGITGSVLLLGLKTAQSVPHPVLGDADYRDHFTEMRERLPERFRQKKVV